MIAVVAAGGFLFYWLRNYLRRRSEEQAPFFVAASTGLVIGDQTIAQADIREVTWFDSAFRLDSQRDHRDTRTYSGVSVETIDGASITLVFGINTTAAEQLALDVGRTLGGIKVGSVRPPD